MIIGNFLRVPSTIEIKKLAKRPIHRTLGTNGLSRFLLEKKLIKCLSETVVMIMVEILLLQFNKISPFEMFWGVSTSTILWTSTTCAGVRREKRSCSYQEGELIHHQELYLELLNLSARLICPGAAGTYQPWTYIYIYQPWPWIYIYIYIYIYISDKSAAW